MANKTKMIKAQKMLARMDRQMKTLGEVIAALGDAPKKPGRKPKAEKAVKVVKAKRGRPAKAKGNKIKVNLKKADIKVISRPKRKYTRKAKVEAVAAAPVNPTPVVENPVVEVAPQAPVQETNVQEAVAA